MKIKFTLLIILSSIIFSSCSNQPDCDDEESINLAKSLITQELKEKSGISLSMFGIEDDGSIDKFVDENIELVSIRPTEKDEELNKCSCATQISFKFPEEFIRKLEEHSKENILITAINKIMTQKLDYDYTLQKIKKDDQLLVEGFVPIEELQTILMNYALIQNAINEENVNNEEETMSEDFSNEKFSVIDNSDIEKAKLWLDNSITKSNEDLKFEETIYTKKYRAFLNDAAPFLWGGDSDLTEEEVKSKWEDEYDLFITDNLSLCGNGSTGTIIPSSKFKKIKENNIIIFETTLTDNGSNETCKKEIRVVKKNNSFFVDGVTAI